MSSIGWLPRDPITSTTISHCTRSGDTALLVNSDASALNMEDEFLFALQIDDIVDEDEQRQHSIELSVVTQTTVSTPPTAGAVKAVRRKSHRVQKRWKKKKPEASEGGEIDSSVRPPVRKQANHFFAVKISDCQIVETVAAVQDSIVRQEPKLRSALISPTSLHITLAVAHLSSEEDLTKARQMLEEAAKHFYNETHSCFPLSLQLARVGHFNNKVVYAGVHDKGVTHLSSLSKLLRDRCSDAGLTIIDNKDDFTPHMTLLKLSKDPRLRRKGIKSVGQHLYESHAECTFGHQIVESVQLLSMTEPKDDYGYYALKGEFHFGTKTMKSASEASAQARDEARSRMRELLLGLAPGPSP